MATKAQIIQFSQNWYRAAKARQLAAAENKRNGVAAYHLNKRLADKVIRAIPYDEVKRRLLAR